MTTSFETKSFKNASLGKDISVLNDIHLSNINISIYQRTIKDLEDEIIQFLNHDFQLKLEGSSEEIIQAFKNALIAQELPQNYLMNDFLDLLKCFETTSKATYFRVFFSTIKTDMCRRFHTDVNELRLLCTYYGLATLWLPEEAEDRDAHHFGEGNEDIVKNPKLIQQANVGDVLILKGGLYPNAKAIIHKSPSIKEKGEKRLLLRIDMNEPLKLI